MEDRLDAPCLFLLQIEQDLGLGVVDDALAIFPVLQSEEVVDVLGSADGRPAVTADDLEDFQDKFRSQTVAVGADELPALVDENGLFLRPVLLGLVPDEIQRHKHPHRQQVAGQLRDIEDGVFVIQRYIGLLIEGSGGTIDQTVENIGKPLGIRGLLQNLVQIPQHRHRPVLARMVRVIQRAVVMGDPQPCVGADQGVVQKLTLLMVHVGDQ